MEVRDREEPSDKEVIPQIATGSPDTVCYRGADCGAYRSHITTVPLNGKYHFV